MFRRFINKSTANENETKDNADEQFCLIRWSDRTGFDIVALKQIKAPAASILVYETYTVDHNGKQRKGTVILKGTRRECEALSYNVSPSTSNSAASTRVDATEHSSKQQSQTAWSTASDILADVQEESSKGLATRNL